MGRHIYIRTATGLLKQGIKTMKDLIKTNFEDMYCKRSIKPIINGYAQNGPLKNERKAVQNTHGRKPRTQITSYLNLPPGINDIVSARLETLQVFSVNNGHIDYDQLIMKAPRKLKRNVSNKFTYQFLEQKKKTK